MEQGADGAAPHFAQVAGKGMAVHGLQCCDAVLPVQDRPGQQEADPRVLPVELRQGTEGEGRILDRPQSGRQEEDELAPLEPLFPHSNSSPGSSTPWGMTAIVSAREG